MLQASMFDPTGEAAFPLSSIFNNLVPTSLGLIDQEEHHSNAHHGYEHNMGGGGPGWSLDVNGIPRKVPMSLCVDCKGLLDQQDWPWEFHERYYRVPKASLPLPRIRPEITGLDDPYSI